MDGGRFRRAAARSLVGYRRAEFLTCRKGVQGLGGRKEPGVLATAFGPSEIAAWDDWLVWRTYDAKKNCFDWFTRAGSVSMDAESRPSDAGVVLKEGIYRLLRRRYVSEAALLADARARLDGHPTESNLYEDDVVYVDSAEIGITSNGEISSVGCAVSLECDERAYPVLVVNATVKSAGVVVDGRLESSKSIVEMKHGSRLRINSTIVIFEQPKVLSQVPTLSDDDLRDALRLVFDHLGPEKASISVKDTVRVFMFSHPEIAEAYVRESKSSVYQLANGESKISKRLIEAVRRRAKKGVANVERIKAPTKHSKLPVLSLRYVPPDV